MRIRALIQYMLAVWLTGCTGLAPPKVLSGDQQLISLHYEPGFVIGPSTGMNILVHTDGRVWIQRIRWDSYGEHKSFRVEKISPLTVARFRQQIAYLRPQGRVSYDNQPPCIEFYPDDGSIDVTWRYAGGEDVLSFSLGCDPKERAVWRESLLNAHKALEIRNLKPPF